MLHINTINYKKPIIFLKIFSKFSEKITEFPQNFQKKITIKPIYCKYTHKKICKSPKFEGSTIQFKY